MTEQQTTVVSTTPGTYPQARAMRKALKAENKRLGKFMAKIRDTTGMSQRELAKLLRVAHSWVSKSEVAQRGVSVQDFITWAGAVNKNASELLGQFVDEHPDASSHEASAATPDSDPQGTC